VGVGVGGPTSNLHVVGDALITGNVVAGYLYGDGSNITGISSASNLQVVTDTGNVTSNTVQFTNATTGFVTTANIEVGGELTVSGDIQVSGLTIQTVSSSKTDTSIFAGTSVTDISGLSVTITPKFANSKILVSYDVNMGGKGRVYLRVKRVQGSSTSYFWSDQGSGGWTQSPGGGAATSTYAGTNTDTEVNGYPFKHLDNAGGLGSITYTVQGWTNHSVYNVCINRGFVDTSAAGHSGMGYWGRCVSSITAQEVCQ